ncbi:GntR family transcriptional regulator [Segeticoccus rhizosphaerae]|uniref:GntR family transcriptional regulator n=1 Tax=Segeticoccus rhizosphaerae TaxID=1104777 RepID=UPI0010BFCA1B|nr:GntR family transcriptional regulator [Ornithinicoccus soli]
MSRPQAAKPHLHETVSEALRSRITAQQIASGDLLPAENSLAQEFGVSRSVIRQALATLRNEGYITTVRGRGAVVTRPTWHRNAQVTAGLSAQMRAMGARVSTQILTYKIERPGGSVSADLGWRKALHLERLRLLDDAPVAFIGTWLPDWVATKVPREALVDQSLHEQLQQRAGITVHGGPREVRAVAVEPAMAESLQIPTGSPVLLLTGQSLDQHGRVVEVFSTWHRSDRIALDIGVLDAIATPSHQRASAEQLQQLELSASELLHRVQELAARLR